MPTSPQDEATVRPADRQKKKHFPPARLSVVHPPEVRVSWALGPAPLTLGRKPDDGEPLLHPTVSRKHLVVLRDDSDGSYLAMDLGSTGGSWIDGVPVERDTRLVDGAVLRLGDVTCVFEQGFDLAAGAAEQVSHEAIPGDAARVRRLRADVARAAPDPSPVLVIGETGTGKEYVARELHRLSGRGGPLLAVNCAELSEQLIESQLFGHERGAFTGADQASRGLFRSASGGTLFLDEIGELPLALQPKLLRALQEGEVLPVGAAQVVKVDVRVIAATNVDLRQQVELGGFRRDLFARLALWELGVPPLRQRRADILGWIERLHQHWLGARPTATRVPLSFDAAAVQQLLLCGWPSNLRQVDQLVHQLASRLRPEELVDAEELARLLPTPTAGSPMTAQPTAPPAATTPAQPQPRAQSQPRAQPKPPAPSKEELQRAIAELGSVRAVAKHYDRDRRQIYRWLDAHGLRDQLKQD